MLYDVLSLLICMKLVIAICWCDAAFGGSCFSVFALVCFGFAYFVFVGSV